MPFLFKPNGFLYGAFYFGEEKNQTSYGPQKQKIPFEDKVEIIEIQDVFLSKAKQSEAQKSIVNTIKNIH